MYNAANVIAPTSDEFTYVYAYTSKLEKRASIWHPCILFDNTLWTLIVATDQNKKYFPCYDGFWHEQKSCHIIINRLHYYNITEDTKVYVIKQGREWWK